MTYFSFEGICLAPSADSFFKTYADLTTVSFADRGRGYKLCARDIASAKNSDVRRILLARKESADKMLPAFFVAEFGPASRIYEGRGDNASIPKTHIFTLAELTSQTRDVWNKPSAFETMDLQTKEFCRARIQLETAIMGFRLGLYSLDQFPHRRYENANDDQAKSAIPVHGTTDLAAYRAEHPTRTLPTPRRLAI